MADHGGRQRTRRERMRGGRKGRSYVWQSRGGRDEGVGGEGERERMRVRLVWRRRSVLGELLVVVCGGPSKLVGEVSRTGTDPLINIDPCNSGQQSKYKLFFRKVNHIFWRKIPR